MIVDSETLHQMRNECNRPEFKKNLVEKLGTKCVNCGSEICIEYHHIVPLTLGGTNNITNIVPLCYGCHEIVHGIKDIRLIRRTKKSGRKRIIPDNYEEPIERYLNGDIGRKECEKLLGLNNTTKLTDKMYFRDYLKDRGIVSYKNRVDMINCKRSKHCDHTGEILSKITFSDGTEKIRYVE